MATIKLTTWNIEHLSKLLPNPTEAERARLRGVRDEILEIDPDVLCMVEAPGNLTALREWVASAEDGLGGRYQVATIPGTEEALAANPNDARAALRDLYAMEGSAVTGNQWIWFLVRDGLFQEADAKMLKPAIWQDLTRQPRWKVHYWGSGISVTHNHWRHPQVLLLRIAGVEIEVIGVHLKSKMNTERAFEGDAAAATELARDYVEEGLKARIKLATEAYDVRRYIERRFEQEANPRIFVCGDMNDGPGREYFEREYQFFDLVSALQGDVFFARRFLNHALFDYAEHLRWSTNWIDRVERWSRQRPEAAALPPEPLDVTRFQLIDHILFTQTLVGEQATPRVEAHAGLVEHTVHQRINATLPSAQHTSDHVPVSVHLTL
jgi:endonuclease/exonuclease/phosphatase family metal-dependent hydrolase